MTNLGTAFFLFLADFYKKYKPPFLHDESNLKDDDFQKFVKDYSLNGDSGIMFLYTLYKNGLGWNSIYRTDKNRSNYIFGLIYDSFLFHLSASAQYQGEQSAKKISNLGNRVLFVLLDLKNFLEKIIPINFKGFFFPVLKKYLFGPILIKFKDVLYNDSQSFYRYLETGDERFLTIKSEKPFIQISD